MKLLAALSFILLIVSILLAGILLTRILITPILSAVTFVVRRGGRTESDE